MGKSKAEQEFERLKKLHNGKDLDMQSGRRHHLSDKEITTLRLNVKGRLTIPTKIASRLELSRFTSFRVAHTKGKLLVLFQKEPSHESKRFFRFGEKTKTNQEQTCYLELGPQLRKLSIEWSKSFDVPFKVKEIGLLEIDIRPMIPALSKSPL